MMTSALFWEARSPVTGRHLYQTLPHPHSGRQWRTYLFFINSRLDCNNFLSSFSVLAPLSTVINNAQCESPTCRVIILKSIFSQNCVIIPKVVLDHPLFKRCKTQIAQ